MADKESKTEEATGKRKAEARQSGQIARSQDLVGWAALFIGLSIVQSTVVKGGRLVMELMHQAGSLISEPDAATAMKFFVDAMYESAIVFAPLALVFVVLGIIGHFAQVRFVLAWKALKPNFQKLNVLKGIKNMVSKRSLFEAAKQVVKLLVLGFVAYKTLWATVSHLGENGPYAIGMIVGLTVTSVMSFLKWVAAIGIVIGIADYFYQRHHTSSEMKMSKDEVKQEGKQQDLAPEIKAKIRQRQASMSRNRMMSAIKESDVVIVNPVHVAVVLKYDPARGAPRVVAKGAGFVAEKIREEADLHKIPLIQDIPLARTLHHACKLDDEVPVELFEAVAKLLAFVFGLRDRGQANGFHKMPGTPELEEYEREEAKRKAASAAAAAEPVLVGV